MKKSILMLLLPLLALASWAQPSGVKTAPELVGSPITWDGNPQALIANTPETVPGYHSSYSGGPRWDGGYYYDDAAGFQYYVRTVFDDAPSNATVGNGYSTYIRPAMHGFYGYANVTATDIGQYQVWYRIMGDGNSYETSDWVKIGEINIIAPTSTTKPYYESGYGPAKIAPLTYNDEEQELITAGTQTCPGYDIGAGGVRYVVKETEGMPTAAEIAAATTSIPTKKNAGTYYVYYQLIHDGGTFSEDGYWTEVGVGGITIDKREITEADFTVEFADGLVYNDADQDLVVDITWTNGIDRTTTFAPNGKVEYIVNDEDPSTGTPTATPQGKNAGDYNVRVVITGDGNHYDYFSALDYGTVNIAKATLTISQEPAGYDNLVYNGGEQQLLKQGVKVKFGTADFATSRFYAKYTMNGVDYTGVDAYKKPKGTDADEDEDNYVITWEVTPVDADNFNTPVGSGEVNVNIAKADWVLNTPEKADDWAYDGLEKSLLKTPLTATGKVTTDVADIKYYINEGTAIAEADVKAKDVDEYEVFYEIEPTTNYNAVPKTSIGTVKVTKVKLHMGAQGLHVQFGDAVDYHDLIKLDMDEIPAGEPLKSDPDALKDALVQFVSFNGATIEAGKPTALPEDAGAYDFTLEPIEGNYEFVNFIPDGTLTIDKIDATPATVAAATLEYNGADQALLDVDDTSLDGGTMLYYVGDAAPVVPEPVDEIGAWSEDIPEAKDADTYTVWYVVKGDKNHYSGTPASIDVTIAPKALADGFFALTSDPDPLVYTGEDLSNAVTISAEDTDISAELAEVDDEDKGDYTVVIPEMINAGEYTFTFTGHGNYTGTATAKISIEPKEITDDDFAFNPESAAYDGDDWVTRVDVVSDLVADADYTVTAPSAMVDASTYAYTFEGIANYTGKIVKSFTITQAENEVTVTIEGWTYGETANDPVTTATFCATGEPTITYAKAVEEGETPVFGTYDDIVNGQAGNYIVKASVEETTNWAAAEATAEFEIAKAASEITAPKFAKNLTYNGLEQALLSAGAVVPEDGKVTYAVNGGAESEDIPVAKNVGTYTIVSTYTPDDNHLPATIEDITVEIHPVVLTFALANVEKTWDGEELTAEQVDKLQGSMYGELQAEDQYEPPFTLTLPEDVAHVTDAGDYHFTQMIITWEEEGVENYNIKFSGEGYIKINKADLVEDKDYTAPTAVADLVFSGEPQALVTEGAMINDYGTIQFATEKEGTYAETVPTGTDAAEYSVFFKVAGDKNHNDTEPVEIKNTIAPKAWTPVLAAFGEETEIEKTYTGEPVLTDEELVLFDGETELEADKDYELAIDPEGLTNVGEYTLTYTGKGNYTGEAVYKVTIAQAAITAEAPKAIEGLKYTAAEQTLITAGGEPSFGTMVYSLDGENYAEELPVGKDAGTYTVYYKVDGDENHAALEPASFDVEIAKLPVIVTAPDATKEFNGIAGLEGAEVGEFVYNGVLANDKIELAGDVVDYLTVKDAKADKGTYVIQVVEDAFNDASVNYEIIATIDGTLTIEQATDEVTVKVAEGFKFTKVYGDAAVVAVPDLVVEGAVAADVDAIKAGVELQKNDYDENVGLQKDAYQLVAKKDAKVFGNYANVTFGTVDMEITKAPLIVSIKAQEKTYDGKPAEIEINAAAIGDMIAVEGLKFDDKADILIGKVTATVGDGNAVNVDEYNIALEGELDNYEITPILGTYTITKAEVNATLAAQKVQQGKALDETAFSGATGIAEGDEEFFYVDAPGLVDMDGIVTGDAGVYAEGLVLAVAEDVADNYTIVADPAELEIIAAEAIVIADNEDWTTEAKEGVDVTFTDRKINAGTWNVIALPFATTVKQVSDAFGYAAVDVLNEDGTTPGEVHFKVISSGDIPAYTPFIVKTTADEGIAKTNFNQVTFHNVNIEAWPEAKNNAITDAAGNEFIGTFKAATPIFGQDMWYMTKGTWYDARKYTEATALTLKAFRAYIHFIEVPAEGARVFIEEPDGSITAINGLQLNNNEANAEGWYTVNGMKLDAAPTQKGTYINNGKKVIVK